MTPMQALVAGDAERRLRRRPQPTSARIEAGKIADLLVLDADPLADIKNIRSIRALMAGGQLVERARLPETRVLSRAPSSDK